MLYFVFPACCFVMIVPCLLPSSFLGNDTSVLFIGPAINPLCQGVRLGEGVKSELDDG